MSNIEQAIATLEHGMESTDMATFHYHRMVEVRAFLRSLKPATEEEIRSIWERKHLYSVMTSLEFCTGFREGEARLLGRREG